jgi:hypothetical protein
LTSRKTLSLGGSMLAFILPFSFSNFHSVTIPPTSELSPLPLLLSMLSSKSLKRIRVYVCSSFFTLVPHLLLSFFSSVLSPASLGHQPSKDQRETVWERTCSAASRRCHLHGWSVLPFPHRSPFLSLLSLLFLLTASQVTLPELESQTRA